ncbi:hypothetical protein [Pseudolabrys taiwanensis]|nr:hypothetical protein [Pseudolabrys taiwanensis]
MTMQDPERGQAEPEIIDSGVHVRDSERGKASTGQIALTACAIIAILAVFFWGVSNQRTEIAGSESTQATTAPAANGDTSGTQAPAQQSQAAQQQSQKEANQQQGKAAPRSNVPETTGQAVNRPAAAPAPGNAQPTDQRPAGTSENAQPPGNQPVQPHGAGK